MKIILPSTLACGLVFRVHYNATDPTGHRDLALDQGGGGGLDIRLPLLSKGEAEKALKSIGQTAVTTASFIPGVRDAIDVYDFMAALYRGEFGEAGFVLAAAALPGSARAARNVGGEVVERIARNLDETEGVFRHLDDDAGNLLDKLVANPCSFSGDTLVLTEDGLAPIAEVGQHEYAWAYNEETGEFGFYPIVAVWAHEDPVVLYLKIDGETLVTTPNHPFYTVAGEWVHAGDLQIGDEIRNGAWQTGTVESLVFNPDPQTMYNFTVATAHTYVVGEGQWLVHNAKCRTPHGDTRHSQGDRPTQYAFQDQQNPLEVYDDNVTGNTVYVGRSGRTHIFTSDGEHHTSFWTTRQNRIQRVLDDLWARR